ncbi:MAG: ABC transporter ATP-binding protein, partial [Rhodospirillaceae bacterium]
LIPTMTALENVAIPMELAGDREAFEKARAQLEAVGLGARIDHYPTQLSGGEQQRTALARAFAIRPDLLLADEPTGNLDQDTDAHIMELMFELKKTHGTTLVLVTHDRSLAQSCDRVVGVRDGKVHDLDLGSGNASAGADAPPISLADAPDTAATLVGAAS